MILQRIRNGSHSSGLWRKIGAIPGAIQLFDGHGHPLPRRFSRPWWKSVVKQCGNGWRRMLLPAGYPASVHPYYTHFTLWNFLQLSLGSAAGVLATQSVLYGLGLTSTTGGSLALSATLNWIIKDGLGQIGGIALMAYLGDRFDVQTKRYRFLAALLLKVAALVECLVPLVPRHFVLTASLANVLKNVCWMTASATRAQIHRHLTNRDNLGDVTGRTAAQNTLASLIGTGLGALLSTLYVSASVTGQEISPLMAVSRCLSLVIPLSILSLLAAYRSCLYVISPRLTTDRLTTLTRTLFTEIIGPHKEIRDLVRLGSLSRYLYNPETICWREPFLWIRRHPKASEPHLKIEPLLRNEGELRSAWMAPNGDYWIRIDNDSKTISIWFNERVQSDETIFKGLLVAMLSRHLLAQQIVVQPSEVADIIDRLFEDILAAFVSRGWQLADIDIGPRHPLRTPMGDKED